jgi:hypothetical protein
MGQQSLQSCLPTGDPWGGGPQGQGAGALTGEPKATPGRSPLQALPVEVVQVPVQAILYLQAMAENGQGDRPKPLGPALPSGYVRYRQ